MKNLLIVIGVALAALYAGGSVGPQGPAPSDAMMADGRPVNMGEICAPDALGGHCSAMRRDTLNYKSGYVLGDLVDLWNRDGLTVPRVADPGSEAPASAEVAAGEVGR